MIGIDDRIISDIEDLRKDFSLEKIYPYYQELSTDMDIFKNEGVYLQELLRTLLSTDKTDFYVETNSDGLPYIIVEGMLFQIEYTPSDIFANQIHLSLDVLVQLIICEMAQVSLPRECLKSHISNEEEAQDIRHVSLEVPSLVKSYEATHISTGSLIGCSPSSLAVIDIRNISSEGFSFIIFEDKNSVVLEYKLGHGCHIKLLKIGDTYVNKLPQFSMSRRQVVYLNYSDSNEVFVCRKDLETNKIEVIKKHSFPASDLSQVCADERGGFIALVNGSIVTYSSDVQPDDVEDLIMDIPADESIVMIQLVARQIYALTNKMNVYSNFPINIANNGNIVWLDKNIQGEILTISRENFKQPTSVDKQTIGLITVTYNNGKIS